MNRMSKMTRMNKIDYYILTYVKKGYKNEDKIIKAVIKKFRVTNFFRINKVYSVDIYHRLLELKASGYIKEG